MILSSIFLALAISCYSISQLQQHGKLAWMNPDKPFAFWGKLSHRRKYRLYNSGSGERWPTSTTLTVFLTDGYHFCQWLMFNFLSLSTTFALGFTWWTLAGVWMGIHLIHWAVYKLLSR
jgi:hypothetical protein